MATAYDALARRWFEEVWNQRRADTIDEMLAPDAVSHLETGLLRGPVSAGRGRRLHPLAPG
jgi:hypothetical protein